MSNLLSRVSSACTASDPAKKEALRQLIVDKFGEGSKLNAWSSGGLGLGLDGGGQTQSEHQQSRMLLMMNVPETD